VRGQLCGHVAEHRGGDEDLLVVGDGTGEAFAPGFVEFREDVVEDDDRVAEARLRAQDRGAGELDREREGPRLAVTGVTARG
jgi:hypothetical protein